MLGGNLGSLLYRDVSVMCDFSSCENHSILYGCVYVLHPYFCKCRVGKSATCELKLFSIKIFTFKMKNVSTTIRVILPTILKMTCLSNVPRGCKVSDTVAEVDSNVISLTS